MQTVMTIQQLTLNGTIECRSHDSTRRLLLNQNVCICKTANIKATRVNAKRDVDDRHLLRRRRQFTGDCRCQLTTCDWQLVHVL